MVKQVSDNCLEHVCFYLVVYGADVFMSASVTKTGTIKSLSQVIFQRSLIGELLISERSSRKLEGSTPTKLYKCCRKRYFFKVYGF
jgi:hypothetical protein